MLNITLVLFFKKSNQNFPTMYVCTLGLYETFSVLYFYCWSPINVITTRGLLEIKTNKPVLYR